MTLWRLLLWPLIVLIWIVMAPICFVRGVYRGWRVRRELRRFERDLHTLVTHRLLVDHERRLKEGQARWH